MDSYDNVISNTPSLSGPSLSGPGPGPGPSIWKYIIIFLILAILGFNLFTYIGTFSKLIGNITDYIIDIFRPILAYFGYGVTETAKKTIDLTAKGSKKVIDVTSGTLTGGLNVLQQGLSKANKDYGQGQGQGQGTSTSTSTSTSTQAKKINYPIPDDSGSKTQKGKSKSGFCYIGEDRGFRSCISVGEGDTCMSGDIFPTREVCINPSLRV
jgi:hypothetical protein